MLLYSIWFSLNYKNCIRYQFIILNNLQINKSVQRIDILRFTNSSVANYFRNLFDTGDSTYLKSMKLTCFLTRNWYLLFIIYLLIVLIQKKLHD